MEEEKKESLTCQEDLHLLEKRDKVKEKDEKSVS